MMTANGEAVVPGGASGPCPVCGASGRAGGDPCIKPDGGTYRDHVHAGRPTRPKGVRPWFAYHVKEGWTYAIARARGVEPSRRWIAKVYSVKRGWLCLGLRPTIREAIRTCNLHADDLLAFHRERP